MIIRLALKETLTKRNITQKELAKMTSIRESTISEMVNNSRSTINKEHLASVMEALDIRNINEIIEIE